LSPSANRNALGTTMRPAESIDPRPVPASRGQPTCPPVTRGTVTPRRTVSRPVTSPSNFSPREFEAERRSCMSIASHGSSNRHRTASAQRPSARRRRKSRRREPRRADTRARRRSGAVVVADLEDEDESGRRHPASKGLKFRGRCAAANRLLSCNRRARGRVHPVGNPALDA
jgi:hypothetical protein